MDGYDVSLLCIGKRGAVYVKSNRQFSTISSDKIL